jgi:2-polyprenyl-3-methyl-5-hydroxy-6-metoxy-1,4-benzoquinol methylase
MDADYGTQYRTLFERHWWWRARERVILSTLARHRPPSGWSTVLDVGCGDGLFFDALAAIPGVTLVEGVEPAEALVSPAGPHRAQIHVAPFDDSFDTGRRYSLVLMLDVLEHLPDAEGALRHAVSLLAPDGVLLATVPAFMGLWTRHDDLNHHVTRYDRRRFRSLAQNAGLLISEARYFFRWTAVVKLLVRLVERVIAGAPAAPALPGRVINRALYLLSRAEEQLLGRAPVPFGRISAAARSPLTGAAPCSCCTC